MRLWVRDTGSGIDPADQPHIFERFYRGKNGRIGGSGLGLAIVHKVVTDHQGTITVEENEPQGVRFVIEMPA